MKVRLTDTREEVARAVEDYKKDKKYEVMSVSREYPQTRRDPDSKYVSVYLEVKRVAK